MNVMKLVSKLNVGDAQALDAVLVCCERVNCGAPAVGWLAGSGGAEGGGGG